MDSLPYVCNNHHDPSTPQTPPHAALASPSLVSSSTLAERPLAASTDNVHRLPPPRISTTTGNCFTRTSTSTVVYGKSRVVQVAAAERFVQ